MSILRYKKNKYSQNGEDGIIEYIFNKLNIKNGNFIEFGAWDGKHLSNTYKLFEEGWSGIYIEGDSIKAQELNKNFKHIERITCINKYVGFTEEDNLDKIIENSTHENKTFDFISIDVDGLDYNIFKSMKKYIPKVICIEVNAGHSPLYDKEIPTNIASNNIGQSLFIISKEGELKDYFPLCYTGNLFLVKNTYKHLFEDHIKLLEDIYEEFLTYINDTNPNALNYLYKTFVKTNAYNNFVFNNQELKNFCEKYY